MPATDPHRRQEIEDWLDSKKVPWDYVPDVPLDTIDLEKSQQNQARVYTKLDSGRVNTYAEAIERGDVFPAVVLNRPTAKGALIAVDANHRLAAYVKAGRETIPAYVITKAAPKAVVALTFEANVKHGLPTSPEERMHQAVWLISNGASEAEAAAMVNVRQAELKRHHQRIRSDQRATEVGILRHQWEPLAQSVKGRLASIGTDEGFKAAASLAFRANLGTEEVFELVTQLNGVRSSARQVALVKNFEDQVGDRIQEQSAGNVGHGRRQSTPKQVFHMALGQLGRLPENPEAIAERFVGEERGEAAKKARNAAIQLATLADLLEAPAAV